MSDISALTIPVKAARSRARPVRSWHLKHEKSPAGGYLTVTVPQVAMLWVARREKAIGPLAFRTWWAIAEMRCRRDVAALDDGGSRREPFHGAGELLRLLGLKPGPESMKPLRAAVRQLEASGLVAWSATRPQLAVSPDQYRGDTAGVFAFLAGIENKRRLVPVPRRWVRWFAVGQSRARSGAALISLMRCLYVRDKQLDPNGSWAATAAGPLLGLSGRALQGARRELAAEGMLRLHPTQPWYLSRFGLRVSINLAWDAGGAAPVVADSGSAPAKVPHGTKVRECQRPDAGEPTIRLGSVSSARSGQNGSVSSAPLHEHPSSSSKEEEFKHQQPPSGRGHGVSIHRTGGKEKAGGRRHGLHLRPEDLHDDALFAEALDRAVDAGKVEPGDRGRLRWWSAREHALRVTAAKGGSAVKLLAWILHRGRWDFVSDGDEADALARRATAARSRERSRGRIRPHPQRCPEPNRPAAPERTIPPALSDDARLLASAQATCQRHRQGVRVLQQLLRKAAPGWSPERERIANQELEEARMARVASNSRPA